MSDEIEFRRVGSALIISHGNRDTVFNPDANYDPSDPIQAERQRIALIDYNRMIERYQEQQRRKCLRDPGGSLGGPWCLLIAAVTLGTLANMEANTGVERLVADSFAQTSATGQYHAHAPKIAVYR